MVKATPRLNISPPIVQESVSDGVVYIMLGQCLSTLGLRGPSAFLWCLSDEISSAQHWENSQINDIPSPDSRRTHGMEQTAYHYLAVVPGAGWKLASIPPIARAWRTIHVPSAGTVTQRDRQSSSNPQGYFVRSLPRGETPGIDVSGSHFLLPQALSWKPVIGSSGF